jgi:hypothetical protein
MNLIGFIPGKEQQSGRNKKKRRSYDRRFFHGAKPRAGKPLYSWFVRADGAKKSSLCFALWD